MVALAFVYHVKRNLLVAPRMHRHPQVVANDVGGSKLRYLTCDLSYVVTAYDNACCAITAQALHLVAANDIGGPVAWNFIVSEWASLTYEHGYRCALPDCPPSPPACRSHHACNQSGNECTLCRSSTVRRKMRVSRVRQLYEATMFVSSLCVVSVKERMFAAFLPCAVSCTRWSTCRCHPRSSSSMHRKFSSACFASQSESTELFLDFFLTVSCTRWATCRCPPRSSSLTTSPPSLHPAVWARRCPRCGVALNPTAMFSASRFAGGESTKLSAHWARVPCYLSHDTLSHQ